MLGVGTRARLGRLHLLLGERQPALLLAHVLLEGPAAALVGRAGGAGGVAAARRSKARA